MSTNKDSFRSDINDSVERVKNDYRQAVTNLEYAIKDVGYEMREPDIGSYRHSIEQLRIRR